ncbi:hypothetical protein [Gloeobacter kilaueensis]|uniref:Uncharacterized protein n=1 Tax=Gloeobacter kilaueensis (strain ATCC BAA-2537 / CCAP 1431/1 / ULC 316 / JS1) TaxID=1183438 RepID=U5QDZ4_GLOK1|nr:hypothetical protein [Gloeobacter kilaueensis]AGY57141.1 hypothetical protein GKIL_0895 [Gloeobacter kilaueensis JS1]
MPSLYDAPYTEFSADTVLTLSKAAGGGAGGVLMQAIGGNFRARIDGQNPASASGFQITPAMGLVEFGFDSLPQGALKVIREAAGTGTLAYNYTR